jgi:hypothetical protein
MIFIGTVPRPFKIFTVALAEGGRVGLVEATGKCLADVPDTVATRYGLPMPEPLYNRPRHGSGCAGLPRLSDT